MRYKIFLFIIIGIGIIFRLLRIPELIGKDYFLFIDPDSYYHLRRIVYETFNYPSILHFDWYSGFPKGIFYNTPAKKLLTDKSGKVTGVLAGVGKNQFTVKTKAVVLARNLPALAQIRASMRTRMTAPGGLCAPGPSCRVWNGPIAGYGGSGSRLSGPVQPEAEVGVVAVEGRSGRADRRQRADNRSGGSADRPTRARA
jgi:hypothetical protein